MIKGSSSLSSRLHGLDHLRSFAIIFVFIYHYGRLFYAPEALTRLGKFGWTGVDLFFVLSGYLIASGLLTHIPEKRVNLQHFFIKRIFRIIPVYVVIVMLYFAFPVLREREALAPLWKYLTFTQNLGLDAGKQGTFSHAWSLCIEEQFYFVFPLILAVLIRLKKLKALFLLLPVLFALGFMMRIYLWKNAVSPYAGTNEFIIYWYKYIYYLTVCRLDGLLTGIFIAAVLKFSPGFSSRIAPYGNILLICSIAILTAGYFCCTVESSFSASVWGFPVVSLGYGLLVLGAISPGSVLFTVRSGLTKKIADLSFAVYLSHKIVLHLCQEQAAALSVEKDSWAMFVIGVAASFTVALALHSLIEKPFLKLRNRLLKRMDSC